MHKMLSNCFNAALLYYVRFVYTQCKEAVWYNAFYEKMAILGWNAHQHRIYLARITRLAA